MSKAVNDGTAVVAFFGRPSHRRFEWAHHRANKRIECIKFWHDLFSTSMYVDRLVHKGNEWCILYESYGVSRARMNEIGHLLKRDQRLCVDSEKPVL